MSHVQALFNYQNLIFSPCIDFNTMHMLKMEFTNNDAKVDVVLSDIYVAGKLLSRIQAERRYMVVEKLKTNSIQNKVPEEECNKQKEVDIGGAMNTDRRTLLQSKIHKRILTLQPKNGEDYVVSEKRLLSSKSDEDVEVLKSELYLVIIAFRILPLH